MPSPAARRPSALHPPRRHEIQMGREPAMELRADFSARYAVKRSRSPRIRTPGGKQEEQRPGHASHEAPGATCQERVVEGQHPFQLRASPPHRRGLVKVLLFGRAVFNGLHMIQAAVFLPAPLQEAPCGSPPPPWLPLERTMMRVALRDGRQAVGDHQARAVLHEFASRALLNQPLRLGVQRRGRLVKNKDGCVLEHRAGDGDPLPLVRRRA